MEIQHTKLVIVGAGIVGSSAAYHLTKMGWRDIVVLDKGDLMENDGSTSHAPGGMHVTNSSKMMTKFATYSTQVYGSLESFEEGRSPFRPVGGIEVAYTPERMADLKRKMGLAAAYDVEAHLLTPQQVAEHIPFMNTDVILGGFYVPGDANVIGTHITACLRRDAEATGGAQFIGNVPVTDFEVTNGHITGVVTAEGTVTCEQVLLCTNIWSPAISEKIGIPIPLMAAQHQYTVTSPLEPLKGEIREIVHPILRHQDFSLYFRQHYDSYGIGNYRHEPLMVNPRDLGKTAMLPFTPEHFNVAWDAARELLPPLNGTELTRKFNGMFAFTVDGYPVMGETSVKGVWTAVGVWITHAGGVGKAIAEWMTDGAPQMDLREADINRFVPHQLTQRYIDLRTAQNYRDRREHV
ncbi:MAG: FAD-binding oxidoreductase [Chloroflexota bacterium]